MNNTTAGGLLMVSPLSCGVREESADVLLSKPVGSESKLSCNHANCGRTCWCEKTNIDDSFEIVSSCGLPHAPQPFAVAVDDKSNVGAGDFEAVSDDEHSVLSGVASPELVEGRTGATSPTENKVVGSGSQIDKILGSRLGGFGSSDAKMIYNIGLRGSLTAGDRERIAIYLGLKQPQHRSTEATVNGHRREQEVFNMLCYDHLVDGWWDVAGAEAETCEDRAGSRFVSNPCVKNTELSRLSGIYCFTHIDITFRQLAPDTSWNKWQVVWYEVKTSRNETAQVLSDYRLQLFWHMWALEDFVQNQGEDDYEISDYWLELLHYKEDNIGGVFSRSRVKEGCFDYEAMEFAHFKETILAGLKIITDSFEAVRAGFVERGEQYLARQDFPEWVAEGLEQLAAFLLKAKKFEAQEAQLKASVRALMEEKQWRRCSTPWFSISLSSDSTRTTLDANKVKEKYPEVYKECLKSAPAKGSLRLELSKSYIVEHGDARGLEEGGVAEEVENV